ncbi:unnamed protein product [Bursaphelenchus xylophilus]|uniref:(pine wood nematode) hypothetical protein n=1 Tax=Bursaphelenchus xylophilus TaxID=6326 RepID=A0A1I7RM53_BURXY|nr:unnamed protein product [Bursaphelenchus xylophilus]CAG9118213.1 unnamed protein product [Bursaphelenchus xylophilus]
MKGKMKRRVDEGCICLDGYSGNYCEIEPKADGCCTKNSDCLGGKTCLFDTNSNCGHCYEKCDDNHYLKDCNKPAYNKFNETKCKNGGKLAYLEDKHMVYCDCQGDGNEMYIGEYCDHRLSRCHKEHTSRLICENAGKCRDDGTRSYCECPEGFTGERCETMIDHCDLAKNGGCVAENTAEYIPHHLSCYCYCKEGYFNETCADEIDPCKERGEDWCGNGVCQSDGPGYAGKHECVCNGKNLLSEDRCLSWKSPCDDNTTCDKRCKVKAHNETVCACRDGYYGETCDPIDYCLSGVCLNDGICHQGVNISKNPWMKCECKEGALGENCEKLTACNGISCGANGTCIEEEGGRYHCECNVGWWGSMCEKPALKCSEGNSPHNCDHGTCNLENDVCECDPGYTGVNCTIPNKNGFNLYFTGEPTDPAKGEVTISGERTGEHAITLTAWVRFEDDVIGNDTVKMTPITVELNEKPVFEISNNGTTWNGEESLSYTGCKLRGWNYYVISYNNTKKILKATINNQYVYQREVAAIQPSGTWSIVLGRKTRDNDFFRGEVGLVELHNKPFTAQEIQRYMENCTGNPFNPENVIVKWKDLKLKGWQRNDVQVIVPGICAQSKCESGAADCSPDSDRFPPLPRNCPSIIKRSTKNRVMQIEWDTKDMFTDDNPIVRISSNYAPNQTFAWGYYHVVYVAVDVKGNIGRCEFDVIVGNENLPDPYEVEVKAVRKPVDSDEIVEYARLECEGDQNFLKDTSPFYTKDVLHRWSRFEKAPLSSYPSCVATTNPEQKVSGGLTWIRGDCKESERIKREIIESLNNASIKFKQEHGLDEGFCPADDCQNITRIDDSCVEEGLRHGRDVEADLGAEKITYEYRLSVNNTKFIVRPFINITLHEWFNDSREYDPTYPLQNFACDPSYPFVRHVQNVTETLDLQFCTDWPAGSFFQSGMNESAPCPVNKCQPNSTQDECVDCPGGRITKDVGCKDEKTECYFPCAAGQYGTYDRCIPCPFGYYNPKPNSSSCATCGSGRTTNTTGADSVSFCYEKCAYLPGHVLDEKDECQECPRGTYRKGTQCQQCNPGFTTRTSAANSEDECSVVDCPKGYTLNKKYKDSFNNITGPHRQYTTYCAPCDRFSFKEVTGNEECQPCPKGTSTNMSGSRAVNDCNVTACNPELSNSCTDGKKCTETDGGQSFTCQYPNLDKSKEENWLYLILLGFFILLFVLLLLLFVSNKRELLRYIDATCPWLLFCWMRKEGNRRFSVNPTRDTSNLPFSPNTQNSDEMEDTSTTEVSAANDPLDSASAIESLPSEEHWMKQRTKHTATLDPLTEIRTNLMHVMTSATSAVSSDSSGKRTPPPILTGSPSRRDMEAAKAAARVARSETYQMATFGQSSPVQSPRVKVEAGIIRHHRTVGPTMVEARPLRAPQFIPRVNTIQAPAPRLASTTEEDDEGFFC